MRGQKLAMKTILAAIDFSPVSRRVIAEAVRLARGLRAKVVVLHAVKPPAIVTDLAPLVGEAVQLTAEVERASRRNLQRWQAKLAKRHVTVETVCQQGFPIGLILGHATRLAADYIVIGSHGHTAFYDLVVGGTASGVLKRAKAAVVVVPARADGTGKPRRASRTRRL